MKLYVEIAHPQFLNKMKYAVGLFGVHYQKNLQHWMPNWIFDVNYKNVLENNKKYLYRDNNITFYASTYFSEKLPQLIEDFKFEKLQLTHMVNEKEGYLPNRWLKRNERFKETIKLILDDNIEYDYVILQRFDLFFKQSVFDYTLVSDKINLICRCKTFHEDTLSDDNFYFIPYKLLKKFYEDLFTMPINIFAHNYSKYIDNIHYLIDEAYCSHEIPIYIIDRTPSIQSE